MSKNSIDLFASTKSNRDEAAKTNVLNAVCKTNNLMQFMRLFQDRQYQTVLNKSLCNYVDLMLSRHLTDSSFESSGSNLWTITEDLIEILTLCPFLSLTETGTNGSISRQLSDLYKFISTKLTRCEQLTNENDEHACLLLSLCIWAMIMSNSTDSLNGNECIRLTRDLLLKTDRFQLKCILHLLRSMDFIVSLKYNTNQNHVEIKEHIIPFFDYLKIQLSSPYYQVNQLILLISLVFLFALFCNLKFCLISTDSTIDLEYSGQI
jgi:hypothetical protein